jgi:uncharacterized protein YdhG (YjbR/CyaY superfamily)
MAEKQTAKAKPTKQAAKRTETASKGFTAEERAAMRERAKELKAAQNDAEAERALLAKIAEMPPSDRSIAERIHEIVRTTAPDLAPRLWYGMPAYAKGGTILCFFQAADKFKSRYATFGFNDGARLDAGTMWPTSWAVTKLTPADEKKIAALVRRAVR